MLYGKTKFDNFVENKQICREMNMKLTRLMNERQKHLFILAIASRINHPEFDKLAIDRVISPPEGEEGSGVVASALASLDKNFPDFGESEYAFLIQIMSAELEDPRVMHPCYDRATYFLSATGGIILSNVSEENYTSEIEKRL